MWTRRLVLIADTTVCLLVALVLWVAAPSRQPAVIAPGSAAAVQAQPEHFLHPLTPGLRLPGADGANQQEEFRRGIATGQLAPETVRVPREQSFRHSVSWDGDLRALPRTPPVKRERPE